MIKSYWKRNGIFTGKQLSKAGLFQFIEQNIDSYQLILIMILKTVDDNKKQFLFD